MVLADIFVEVARPQARGQRLVLRLAGLEPGFEEIHIPHPGKEGDGREHKDFGESWKHLYL